jgi:hypothetical protein
LARLLVRDRGEAWHQDGSMAWHGIAWESGTAVAAFGGARRWDALVEARALITITGAIVLTGLYSVGYRTRKGAIHLPSCGIAPCISSPNHAQCSSAYPPPPTLEPTARPRAWVTLHPPAAPPRVWRSSISSAGPLAKPTLLIYTICIPTPSLLHVCEAR